MLSRFFIGQVGRRGAALLFFALLDVVYAVSLIDPPEEARRSPSLTFASKVVPLWVWAMLWLLVGIVCLAGAVSRHDRLAFTAAMAIKTLWGTVFLAGWAIAGLDRGWVSAIVWLAMAGWVLIISSWPEPPAPPPAPPPVSEERLL